MRKLTLRFFLGLVLLVFVVVLVTVAPSITAQNQELFPLEDVRPGLKGIGKTIIAGNFIEDFDVEILGLVPQSPPLQNLIMVKVSGEPMDRSGGIAQGMSGTPVYVQGRLLGAIGYTFPLTDHRLGLVTPAVDMFKLYDELPGVTLSEPVLPRSAEAVRSPLLVQGLNFRNTDFLQKAMSPYQVQLMPGLTAQGDVVSVPLQAGGMVGVQFLRGDFQVASFGTVTHVKDDGRFLAFGHPFTHLGVVDFFASAAYVHYTLPNQDMPFKITSLGSTVGSISQDRAVGLGGNLNREPKYIPVSTTVKDLDRGVSQDYFVEAITQQDILIPLVIASAYQSVDASLDRIGAGTSFVRLEFDAGNIPQRIIRENLYYSDTDIAVWSLTDLAVGLELLVNNSLQEVNLDHIRIEVEVEQTRKTATIEKATPAKSNVRAGEYVDVEVSIRPYRAPAENRIMRLQIPQDTATGLLTVTVRAGGAGYYVSKPPIHTEILTQSEDDDEPIRAIVSGAETLDALINEFVDRERNNEIVAEFYPFFQIYEEGSVLQENDLDFGDSLNLYSWADGATEAKTVRLTTQFVIDGMATFDLHIY